MTNSIFDVFRIDRLGKGIFTKILFTFALIAGVSVYFYPLGDTDFTPFLVWAQEAFSDFELFMTTDVMSIPLSTGNIIYLMHIMAADFVMVFCGFIYCGVYIRQYRKEHDIMDPGDSGYLIPPRFLTPLNAGKLMLRMVIVFCFSLVIFLPAMFTLLYLFLIFIIILPYISMYPACYLSGDSGFFGSFTEMVRVTKGYYFVNARISTLIIMLMLIGRWITTGLMSFLPSAAYIIGPLINVTLVLSYGRFVGKIYCRMREVPGGLRL